MAAEKIIFDTDIGGDCDDAGTLAILHRLCELGEAELLAVTACYDSPYVAGCIDAINRYYGREVPVGINYGENLGANVYAQGLCEGFPNRYPASCMGTEAAPPDSLALIRKILSEAEDHSITLVATGMMTNLCRLVTSEADESSPLDGKTLIAKKIRRTVVMGGRFFETWPMVIYAENNVSYPPVIAEWNIHESITSAQTVCREWPGELVFSSFEIGNYIHTLAGWNEKAPADHPVRAAYDLHNQGRGRCSWDQTAMLDAVRPGLYWDYHEFGRITVDDEGVTRWNREEGGRQTYLMPKADYEVVRRVIDELALPQE